MPLRLIWRRAADALISEWVSGVVNDVRQCCNGWESGGKAAPGGYSMPKHHTMWRVKRRYSTGIYLTRVVQEASLQNDLYFKWNNKTYFGIFSETKVVTLLLELPSGLVEVIWVFLLLVNNSHNHVVEGGEKINILFNVFLMFVLLSSSDLKFHVYGNVIKRIKRWQCVFCYVCLFFQTTWKKCNLYEECQINTATCTTDVKVYSWTSVFNAGV